MLKQDGEQNFYDIWIVVESIKDQEQLKQIKSLDELTQMNLTHWDKEMLYPYENKFIKFNDIAASLNGFARIIEFRTF